MNRLALIFTLLFTMSASNAQVWATAISKNESLGTAIVYRYIAELKADFERASQSCRIIVVWKYQGDKGMPSLAERARMDDLEDALAPLQEDGSSTLALVSTGDNLKEWTYYAKSEETFLTRLNLALRAKPAFPIEIHTAPDPTWTTYERFVAGIRK